MKERGYPQYEIRLREDETAGRRTVRRAMQRIEDCFRERSAFLAIALLLCLVPATSNAATGYTTNFPEVVAPGQSVEITGTFDPAKPATIKIFQVGTNTLVKTLASSNTATAASVKLPSDLGVGRYYFTLDNQAQTDVLVPGELRVQRNPVQLDAAHPATAYRNEDGSFDFDIVGQNFSGNPEDYQVYISGQGPIIRDWAKGDCPPAKLRPCLALQSPEKLRVSGYHAERYQGLLLLSVGIKETGIRSAEKQLILSRMSETGVLLWTAVIFLALGLAIYSLVSKGIQENVINGRRYSPFWFFFIDKQTNSYSLSKFQLFMLFSCFVFGYLYVFLCRWLVQWQFVLPDVPSSFSGILAMSAGTTVVAAGATQARGSKGAGPVFPSAADFISIGGQVVPERFQFFVWTLVASFGFIALLVSQNPATISGFPDFPQGLLYVMGVSAGGYLAGKITRAPGPIIRNIAWDVANSQITIQGENLSSEADFWVDDTKLPIDPTAKQSLVKTTPQEQAADRTFCTELKITIGPAAGLDLRTGDHIFKIVNRDGQFSEAPFTADPPAITQVFVPPSDNSAVAAGLKQVPAGKQSVDALVVGSGFRMGSTVKWTPANTTDPVELTPSAVRLVDQNNLKVTLVPGDPGSATLMVVTPKGFSATATVAVT